MKLVLFESFTHIHKGFPVIIYFLGTVMKRRYSEGKMRAVMVHRFGGVEHMKVENNAAVPNPAHNQVSSELYIGMEYFNFTPSLFSMGYNCVRDRGDSSGHFPLRRSGLQPTLLKSSL